MTLTLKMTPHRPTRATTEGSPAASGESLRQKPDQKSRQKADHTSRQKAGPNGAVRVTVLYCPIANYQGVAKRLAAAIDREFGVDPVEVDLEPASGGVYEISVNGKLVFSKRATWRLPDDDEIFYHVRVALGRLPGPGAVIPPSG